MGKVPRCILGEHQKQCYTFAYTPTGNAVVDTIVKNLAVAEGIPDSEIISFTNQTQVDDFVRLNPNVTQAAVSFDFSSSNTFSYNLQYNQTDQYNRGKKLDITQYLVLPLQQALDREILRYAAQNPSLEYELSTSAFPHPELLAQDIVAAAGPSFFVSFPQSLYLD